VFWLLQLLQRNGGCYDHSRVSSPGSLESHEKDSDWLEKSGGLSLERVDPPSRRSDAGSGTETNYFNAQNVTHRNNTSIRGGGAVSYDLEACDLTHFPAVVMIRRPPQLVIKSPVGNSRLYIWTALFFIHVFFVVLSVLMVAFSTVIQRCSLYYEDERPTTAIG